MDRVKIQELLNDIFTRPPVNNARCIIGTKKSSDCEFYYAYEEDKHFQAHRNYKSCFTLLIKFKTLQPYKTQADIRKENNRRQIVYILYFWMYIIIRSYQLLNLLE